MPSYLFVDYRVRDIDALLADLGWDIEVVLLNAQEDGVYQIIRVLEGAADLDAIDIVSCPCTTSA